MLCGKCREVWRERQGVDMKIIDRHNFFETGCVIFTILAFGKIVLEAIVQGAFGNYQENLLMMLFLSFLATFVLSQHYRFQKYPLLAVILVQYVFLAGVLLLVAWIMGHFQELHEDAYRDMFLSFSIPYAVGAVIYYIVLFYEIKRANQVLKEIKEQGGGNR